MSGYLVGGYIVVVILVGVGLLTEGRAGWDGWLGNVYYVTSDSSKKHCPNYATNQNSDDSNVRLRNRINFN